MVTRLSLPLTYLLLLLGTGCGESPSNSDDEIFFALERAAELAEEGLLDPDDLPLGGWTVKSRSSTEGSDVFDLETQQRAMSLTQCSRFLDQARSDPVIDDFFFGTDPSHTPVGTADAVITRLSGFNLMQLILQIHLEPTPQHSQEIVGHLQPVFQSIESAPTCLAALTADANDATSAVALPVAPPVFMAGVQALFAVQVGNVDFLQGVSVWSYGNALVFVGWLGPADRMTTDFVNEILNIVQEKLERVEEAQ